MFFSGKMMVFISFRRAAIVFFLMLLIGNILLVSVSLFVMVKLGFIGLFMVSDNRFVVIVIFVDGLFFGVVSAGTWTWSDVLVRYLLLGFFNFKNFCVNVCVIVFDFFMMLLSWLVVFNVFLLLSESIVVYSM